MSIKGLLQDGKGTGNLLKVDEEGGLVVSQTGVPAGETSVFSLKPFSLFMVDDLDDEDMRVNASLSEPEDFIISSSPEGDRFIHTLAITLADAGASLNEFGNLSARTNGCQLILEDEALGDVILVDSVKTNFEIIQMCNFKPAFGNSNNVFRAPNVSGASEAFVGVLDLDEVFGLPHGVRIPQDSTKRLIFRIRDNVSGVDRFDIKCFGYDKIRNKKKD